MGTNVETLKQSHLAFNQRAWPAFAASWTSDGTFTDHARGVQMHGPQQIVAYLQDNWVAAFSDLQLTEETYSAGVDHVLCEFTAAGTNDGPLGPLPATGKPSRAEICEIVQFNPDGKVTAAGLYYDQMSILIQLGHVGAPTAA